MPDLIGKSLGPYRILEQIGVGGMATVFRAYQPGMDRDVALKILPVHFARGDEFAILLPESRVVRYPWPAGESTRCRVSVELRALAASVREDRGRLVVLVFPTFPVFLLLALLCF